MNHKNNNHKSKKTNGKNGNNHHFLSKKFLFVSEESLSGDLAWKIKKEGHDVRIYIASKSAKDVYLGFLEKVDNWKKSVSWADVIVFDCIGFGKEADKLRKRGKLVIGGSLYTDRLEEDREFGQREMEKGGMMTPPHWDFDSFEDATEFIRRNPSRYVFKPSGNTSLYKEILFLGNEGDGKDIIEVLRQNKTLWKKKIKRFQLQKKIEGVEVAAGAFFNGRDFIYPVNINFEHKKLFPGDIGPSTDEMGCYDEKTEVLTDIGWKFFKDLNKNERLCTLNPSNDSIEFQKPNHIVSFNHHKELISVQNQTLDICVTSDHNMYLCSQTNYRKNKKNFELIKAKDMECQSVIKRTGNWIGKEEKYFVLPQSTLGHYKGNKVIQHPLPGIKVPIDDWISFMGIWIAEGSVAGKRVTIAQKTPAKCKIIEKLLKKLPFGFKPYKKRGFFYTDKKQLADYLKQFKKAPDKYVPHFIKELSKRQIELFLREYCFGDGTIMRGGIEYFIPHQKNLQMMFKNFY